MKCTIKNLRPIVCMSLCLATTYLQSEVTPLPQLPPPTLPAVGLPTISFAPPTPTPTTPAPTAPTPETSSVQPASAPHISSTPTGTTSTSSTTQSTTTPTIFNNSSTLDIQISFNDQDHIQTLSKGASIAIPANCSLMYYSPNLKKTVQSWNITANKSYKITPDKKLENIIIEMI